jgi:hypothetical protein
VVRQALEIARAGARPRTHTGPESAA